MLNTDYVSVDAFIRPAPLEIEVGGKEARQCSYEIKFEGVLS